MRAGHLFIIAVLERRISTRTASRFLHFGTGGENAAKTVNGNPWFLARLGVMDVKLAWASNKLAFWTCNRSARQAPSGLADNSDVLGAAQDPTTAGLG